MAYTTVNKSTDYFNTKLYSGTTNSSDAITGVGFQPDLVWLKSRSNAGWHWLTDAVRGTTKTIYSNSTTAEQTNADGVTAFNADGFTIGNNTDINGSGKTFVGWNWKANGSGSANTSGSINSTVSVNTTAGLSIVSFTGTAANATVGHGLGVVPKVIITKSRVNAENWGVYHETLGNTKQVTLNTNGAATGASAAYYNNTSPTTTVFTVGTADSTNDNQNMIAYCFAEKTGYSKFGKYTGNGSTDGTFVYTGFKPAWVMIKRTDSTANWRMIDNKRNAYNILPRTLTASQNAVEYTGTDDFGNTDILSNGFKIKTSYAEANASGGSYIYMAFGQSLVGTNNVVANAR